MIYVHVPFCRSFCSYCDFYSELACKGREGALIGGWLEFLKEEISARRSETDSTLGTNTLYIGGGTPSVLPLSVIKEIVQTLGKGPYEEFTIEVNPEDIVEKGTGYVKGLLEAGVTRISMGVQSLDNGILKWMNRRHDADRARRAMALLRECGCDNISLDLIFGISHLPTETLESTLDEILSFRPEHLSAYQLSIEEGSTLAELVGKGLYQEADEELCRGQYELIGRRLAAAGYHHYEISNWAVPGKEAVHNSAYWTREPYVGFGPGAHSFLIGADGTQRRFWNSRELKHWTSEGETLTAEQIREEELMLGLRTDKGFGGTVIPEKDWFISEKIISEII